MAGYEGTAGENSRHPATPLEISIAENRVARLLV